MKAGRALDELIHENIFGYRKISQCELDQLKHSWVWEGVTQISDPQKCPSYSTNIKDAWEVVEKMKDRMPLIQLTESCGEFFYVAEFHTHIVTSKTAPHSICLAALKAKGIDV